MSEEDLNDKGAAPKVSAVEAFLVSVESKATDPIHKRLLTAARGESPAQCVEAELRTVITEILHDA